MLVSLQSSISRLVINSARMSSRHVLTFSFSSSYFACSEVFNALCLIATVRNGVEKVEEPG